MSREPVLVCMPILLVQCVHTLADFDINAAVHGARLVEYEALESSLESVLINSSSNSPRGLRSASTT
jgi:hypothetical protein